MKRPSSMHQPVVATLSLACMAAAWWGCSTSPDTSSTGASQSASSGSGDTASSATTGGAGGTGGASATSGTGGSDSDASTICTSTSATAHAVNVDIIFLIDQSASMAGPKWTGTTKALTTFFNDPASAKLGVGLSYFPNYKVAACTPLDYETLNVPIDVLPMNAFALSNSIPANAKGSSTPTYGALKGALTAATAFQDAHPTHKVILVLATDGEPNGCDTKTNDDVVSVAASARNYNGVLTYVIGAAGSNIPNLDKVAAAGGTTAAYDITNDIGQFSAKIAEIRKVAIGCEFEIPAPPGGMLLNPDEVNFSYTPKGVGLPTLLPRADDLADCNGKPGWYYNTAVGPTKIIICPASCSTVQADASAKVSVLFGCQSIPN